MQKRQIVCEPPAVLEGQNNQIYLFQEIEKIRSYSHVNIFDCSALEHLAGNDALWKHSIGGKICAAAFKVSK
jgi:hypothetical protein